jgi:glycosyltransferase involved in cell wall biosynthesis
MEATSAPRVTAIIGTWNRARFVPEAIRSLLDQTVRDIEVIVADDGSTDDTADVVGRIDDPRVRLLQGPHVGISRNLNRALDVARGSYVALLDSDDWSLPTRLERQAEVLDARPEVAVVGHRMDEVDEEGRTLQPRVTFAAGDVNGSLMRFNPISNSCAMLRRAEVLELGGFDPDYRVAVDYDLWLRVADRHVVHTLDEVLGVRRMHAGSVSIGREREQLRAAMRARVATMRRRRSPRGAAGLVLPAISYVTPMALKRARRRRLEQAV